MGIRVKERETKILELLAKEKRLEVAALAQVLGVSSVTVRKDLDTLEEKGGTAAGAWLCPLKKRGRSLQPAGLPLRLQGADCQTGGSAGGGRGDGDD